MDLVEHDSVSKVHSENQSLRLKMNSGIHRNTPPPILQKSGLGHQTEPTRDPTVDLSSTKSIGRGRNLDQSKQSRRIHVGSKQADKSLLARKRYFSIFDTHAAQQPRINEESKDDGDSLINSVAYGDGSEVQSITDQSARILKARSFNKPLSMYDSQSELPEIHHVGRGKVGEAQVIRTMYMETLESVVDRYRPERSLLFNPKAELRDMINKIGRRIVVRGFGKNSRSVERSHMDKIRPTRLSITMVDHALNHTDSHENVEQQDARRKYQGHDSPIKTKTLQKQFTEFKQDHLNDHASGIPLNNTPVIKGTKGKSGGRYSNRSPSKAYDDDTINRIATLSNLDKDMITLESMSTTKKNPLSTPSLDKYLSPQKSNVSITPSKKFQEVGEFSIAPLDDGRSTDTNPASGYGKSQTQQDRSKPRSSHFSSMESRPIASLAMRGLESLTVKVKPPNQTSLQVQELSPESASQYKTAMYDLNHPDFDINKYKFLLFGKSYQNFKELKKFIKEIKLDLEIVRKTPQKEPCPAKVVLVDLDRSNSTPNTRQTYIVSRSR